MGGEGQPQTNAGIPILLLAKQFYLFILLCRYLIITEANVLKVGYVICGKTDQATQLPLEVLHGNSWIVIIQTVKRNSQSTLESIEQILDGPINRPIRSSIHDAVASSLDGLEDEWVPVSRKIVHRKAKAAATRHGRSNISNDSNDQVEESMHVGSTLSPHVYPSPGVLVGGSSLAGDSHCNIESFGVSVWSLLPCTFANRSLSTRSIGLLNESTELVNIDNVPTTDTHHAERIRHRPIIMPKLKVSWKVGLVCGCGSNLPRQAETVFGAGDLGGLVEAARAVVKECVHLVLVDLWVKETEKGDVVQRSSPKDFSEVVACPSVRTAMALLNLARSMTITRLLRWVQALLPQPLNQRVVLELVLLNELVQFAHVLAVRKAPAAGRVRGDRNDRPQRRALGWRHRIRRRGESSTCARCLLPPRPSLRDHSAPRRGVWRREGLAGWRLGGTEGGSTAQVPKFEFQA